jgi:hypothetical protein
MLSDASALMVPQVRARHMQGVLADLSRLPEPDRQAILAAIPPATLEAIRTGSLLGWVPFRCDVEVSRAIAEHLGPSRAHDFFRGQILGAMETNLLAGLVQGAMRLAGANPRLYLPFLVKGYDILFANCGRFSARYEPPNSAVIDLRGLPPEAMEDEHWIGSLASSFCGMSENIGFEARVVISQLNVKDRAVTFIGTWHARR